MSRPLPLKIQTRVLSHLEGDESITETETLTTCCLVCWDWCRVCQKRLQRIVSLSTPSHLERLAASLSSALAASQLVGAYITELSLICNAVEPFYRRAPYTLASKLLSLRRLVIDGGDQYRWFGPGPYLGHPSLPMHLKHLKTVTELRLTHIMF